MGENGLKISTEKLKGNEDMEEDKELSFTDIVALLIKIDENLNIKTNIPDAKRITALHLIEDMLTRDKEKEIGKYCNANIPVRNFLQLYKELAPSEDGQRVGKVVTALQSILEHERERVSLGVRLKENVI